MLTYNLTALTRFIIGRQLDDTKDSHNGALIGTWPMVGGVAENTFLVISLSAFNLGCWYFGFHYFKCSSEMEFVRTSPGHQPHTDRVKLVKRQKRNSIIFYTVAAANVLSCISLGVVLIIVQL